MALNKATLQTSLQAIFEDLSDKSAADVAQQMADAIDAYVKTGTVPAGIPITGTSPTGPVTGTTSGPGSIV
jgi:hypothetical protein